MKFGKVFFLLLAFFIVFACLEICAQNSNLQIKPSNLKDKSSPFKEGETLIAEVKFTGLDSNYEEYKDAVYESEFVSSLKINRKMIAAGEKFDSQKVENILRLLKEWLAASGYLKAEVVALGEKLPKNRMKLIFSVERGMITRVSEIRFIGNLNITNDEFVVDFKQCIGNGWEIFEYRKYDYITKKCSRSLMFSRGYFNASIKGINRRLVDDNYVVTIEVVEGVRYRIGEIKITGATVFTKKEILEMLGQSEGDIADGRKLQDFIYEKLKRIYADKGFVLYNSEFDPKFIEPIAEGLDGIVNLDVTIDEGKRFKVFKLVFTGIDKQIENKLKENFSLKEGDIFNQTEFEKELKRIEETKDYYEIDIDQDVEIRTDEKEAELFIIVKLYPTK